MLRKAKVGTPMSEGNPHERLFKIVETVSTKGGIGPVPDARETDPKQGPDTAPESERNGEHKGGENTFLETTPCKGQKQDCFTTADTPNAVGNGSAPLRRPHAMMETPCNDFG